MDLQITGTVTRILEEKSGEGKNGPWRKQDFILETEGRYPREVCVTQWGENIEKFDLREGDTVTAHIDLRSREYEGRWYTDVKAWRVEKHDGGAGAGPDRGPGPTPEPTDADIDDDLPF